MFIEITTEKEIPVQSTITYHYMGEHNPLFTFKNIFTEIGYMDFEIKTKRNE